MRKEFYADPAIQIQRVRKSFGDHVVLKNASFTISKQGIHGLVGLSGAGKTTLLNCLIGYYDIDAGRILISGEEPQDALASHIGFTTQENCFYQDLTLADNIRYFGGIYDVPKDKLWKRGKKLLKLTQLDASLSTKAENLSGGMKRRFDLVLSLLHHPQILILDEPATGLDPKLRGTIWEIVKYINNLGVTTIISSHLLNDLEEICTQISLLHNGTIVSTGAPEALRDLFSHHHQIQLRTNPGNYQSVVVNLQQHDIDVANPRKENDKLLFNVDQPHKILGVLDNALRDTEETIIDVKIQKPGLTSLMEKVA